MPSLNIESSNGRAFPRLYIRGYGNTDFHDFASQPVGLYYDDIVQENAALKGFPIFDQADVEVLRGPQGTLFGRNSPAGVVKFESAKPELGVTSAYFSMSDGTFNTAVVEGDGEPARSTTCWRSAPRPRSNTATTGSTTPSTRPSSAATTIGARACSCSSSRAILSAR